LCRPGGAGSGIPLEIHWHLDRPGRPFAIDLEGLWARAVPTCIAGVASLALAPEDLLLYLCLHACKHGLTGSLRPLCDVAATIQRYAPTLDWGQLQQRAAHWRVTPYVYLPLQLASDLVGAAVPDACLTALQPEGFEPRLRSWATAVLLEEPGTPPLFPALLRLWQGPRLRDRLTVVRQSLAPAAVAQASGRAPGSKRRYGYALVHLATLLRRYGPTLWRLCRRDPALTAVAEGKVHLARWLQPFAHRRG
jgi:putative nucleotidyltransferase-like protein